MADRRLHLQSLLTAACLITLFGILLAASWIRWYDPLGDFGREAYTAWRVSLGETLYRDVAYFNGPLSPYVNALVLRLCGPHALSLNLANAIAVLPLTALIYALFTRVGDRIAGALCAAAFLVMFGFAHLLPVGDYNFISPYSHEVTHGTILSLLMLWLLAGDAKTQGRWRVFLAGSVLGLTLLTKAEFGLASVASVAAFAWAGTRAGRPLFSGQALIAFVAGAATPPLAGFALFSSALGSREALLAIAGSWRYLTRPGLLNVPNYAYSLGVSDTTSSVATAGVWLVLWAVVLVPFLAASLCTPATRLRRCLVLSACAGYPFLVSALSLKALPWLGAFRPLPVALLAMLAWQASHLRVTGAMAEQVPLRVALLVFASVLLARTLGHVTVCHYGFALALPGTLLLFTALTTWLPNALSAAGNYGSAFRAGALGLVSVLLVIHLAISLRWYSSKGFLVGKGANAFLTDGTGPVLAATLAQIERVAAPGTPFLVVPGGALLNVVARRPSPTPYVSLFPPELAMFGEGPILSALRRRPPALVVLVRRETSEYGFPRFGIGYGQQIMAWLAERYSRVAVIGADPLEGSAFGVSLLVAANVQ